MRLSIRGWFALTLLATFVSAAAAGAPSGQENDAAREIFSEIDSVLHDLSKITKFTIHHEVPAEMISRDKVKAFLEKRIKEVATPEEIRIEELTLKKFGLVPQDFDLAKNTVDLLTEQAAAFYDFTRKKMYITDWTPSATREPALVHELAHALADQDFNLDKFTKKGRKSDDGSLARMAVMEGQASWLMAEYLARKAGQSLATSPALLETMVRSIEAGAGQFPVFEAEPLYLRETLVFPYTQGLLFQNAVYKRDGVAGFSEVFRHAPVSTQQVLHPELYFSGTAPVRVPLPQDPGGHGFKRIAEGTVGELDHQILIQQYGNREQALSLAPHWRGGDYALMERNASQRVVLLYASSWEDAAAANSFFHFYRQALGKKWKQMKIASESETAVSGTGDDGYFKLEQAGNSVTSVEGAENPVSGVR